MTDTQEYAFLTGGASGIGRETVKMLVKKNIRVFVADRDMAGCESLAQELNQKSETMSYAAADITDWESLAKVFTQALHKFGRIDYVYAIAGIGDRRWLSHIPGSIEFQKPDLTVVDVNLNGVLYTCALAVQQMRRQNPGQYGFRGKIACVSSTAGLYPFPTAPIYAAAKHGVTGFVRSYGEYLPREKITLNAVNPHVVRTNLTSAAFYKLIPEDHLTPIEGVVEVFESFLGEDARSGENIEVGPRWKQTGPISRKAPEWPDKEMKAVADLVLEKNLSREAPQ